MTRYATCIACAVMLGMAVLLPLEARAVSFEFDHITGWWARNGQIQAADGRLVLQPRTAPAAEDDPAPKDGTAPKGVIASHGTFIDLRATPYLIIKRDEGQYSVRLADADSRGAAQTVAENVTDPVLVVNLAEKLKLTGKRNLSIAIQAPTLTKLDFVRFARTPQDTMALPAGQSPVPPLAEYSCRRTLGPIKIDGVLDEASWLKATGTGAFRRYHGLDFSDLRTEAKLLWDDERLYIAITVADPDVRASRTLRDDDIFAEDCVEFFIMEQYRKDRQHYLEYEINALGTQFDAYNLAPLQGILNWDSRGWKSAIKVHGTLNNSKDTDQGWTAEMSIPFFDFYGTIFLNEARSRQYLPGEWTSAAPRPGDRWRVNLYRIKDTKEYIEYQAWSPVITPGFHNPARFGTLIFSDQPAGVEEQK